MAYEALSGGVANGERQAANGEWRVKDKKQFAIHASRSHGAICLSPFAVRHSLSQFQARRNE
jgi:hypothetical protein